jgi:hypothetical protein
MMFLNSGPSNFISNGGIDARCNKDAIIIYCTLVPIPQECIIFGDIIVLHIQYDVKQALFQGQLRQSLENVVWFFMDFTRPMMVGTTNCANSFNFIQTQ